MPLKVIHQGNESVIDNDAMALIGSDASSTIRIVRPGISRRHAVLSYDGSTWRIEDAGSRNGTFIDGRRVQTLPVDGPTTLYLGHPTDGEVVSLVPVAPDGGTTVKEPAPEQDAFDLPKTPPPAKTPSTPPPRSSAPTRVQRAAPTDATKASEVELAQLTAAIRDQISAIKGLTWSVWAMIAVTAALIVMTLFVGILSN